jgi:hypothetical protein
MNTPETIVLAVVGRLHRTAHQLERWADALHYRFVPPPDICRTCRGEGWKRRGGPCPDCITGCPAWDEQIARDAAIAASDNITVLFP